MCFSVWTIVQFLVAIVCLWGLFRIAGILASFFVEVFGPSGTRLFEILRIIVTCIIAIWMIYIVADVLVCAMPLGPFGRTH